jgi:hypothetical protein
MQRVFPVPPSVTRAEDGVYPGTMAVEHFTGYLESGRYWLDWLACWEAGQRQLAAEWRERGEAERVAEGAG